MRQTQSRPLADALHAWMVLQRGKILDGSAMAKALDYSLRRWSALTRFFDDGQLPIDNNRGGKSDQALGPWPSQLVICRLAARGPARRGHHEPDSKRPAQRACPLRLPQGCADPAAHAKKQPDCTDAASPWATCSGTPPCHNEGAESKVCCPVAYGEQSQAPDK